MSAGRLAPLLSLALASLGCTAPAPTEIVLVVDSNLPPGELTSVRLFVTAPSGERTELESPVGPGAVSLPATLGIAHADGPLSPLSVLVIGARDGVEQVRASARTGFVAHESRMLYLLLDARCVGTLCGSADETCREGTCTDDRLPPEVLPRFHRNGDLPDAGTLDASPGDAAPPDVGPPDAPVDAGPIVPSGPRPAVELSSGAAHTCAVRAGELWCWGSAENGRIDDGTGDTAAPRATPVAVVGMGDVVEVALGRAHTCARRSDGTVRCIGVDGRGQRGDGASGSRVNGLDDAAQIASGYDHSCAVRDTAEVVCWGAGTVGQLGNDARADAPSPVVVANLIDGVEAATGESHTCVRRLAGDVACFGDNSVGQLGDGTLDASAVPVQVVGLDGVARLGAGASHTCAVLASGELRCWGDATSGQLGDGRSAGFATTPVTALAAGMALDVGGGVAHTCAVGATRLVRCVGENALGQLGTDDAVPRIVWAEAVGVTDARQVAAGNQHTCILRNGGGVRCWGDDASGQVGDGAPGDSQRLPITVLGLP